MKNTISIVYVRSTDRYRLEYNLDEGKRCGVHELSKDTKLGDLLRVMNLICYLPTATINWLIV